jgi:hypothetical protein
MKTLFFVLVLTTAAVAGYTTPNTGVRWTPDSLVLHSAGAVTGTFPQYTVNDTVFIAPNDLLQFRSGSVIRIAYRKGITVRGGFLALGSNDSLITFTKSDSTWQELRFEDSAVDSLCRMEHVVIEYARLGLNFVSASPTVQYSTIRNTGTVSGTLAGSGNYAIQCFNSNAVIRFDSIYNNAQYGININSGANPLIEHCVIFNNNLQGTAFKNQISVGTQGVNSPTVRNNRIFHTVPNIRVGGISISAFFAGSGSAALIEGNDIHHNAYGIAVASQGTSTLNVMIRNNRIHDNTYSDQNAAGSGINFNSASPSVQQSIVTGNEITGNSWGVTILGNAKPNLGDLTNADTSDDGRNIFIGNKNRDTLFALYNNSPGQISAQNNYWGTSDADSVARLIFDNSDIPSLGLVTYLPFLVKSPVLSSSRPIREPYSFVLGQNYPNPFNPVTTIGFQLSVAGWTTLEVCDMLGRVVERLVNEEKGAGAYSIQWNASNVASGTYLVRLTSGANSHVRKLLLIK